MKHLLLSLFVAVVMIVSCTKTDPYDTNLTARLEGAYKGSLDSTNATVGFTRINDNTARFDLYYTDSTHHVHFDSVAMNTPSTFLMYGNTVFAGSGKFQGNIMSFTIRAIQDTTEVHKFYGNK